MRLDRPFRRSEAGISLVEILAGTAIVGVLTAVVFAGAGRYLDSAREVRFAGNLRTIASGILAYHAEYGALPGPTHLGVSAVDFEPWDPKHLPTMLKDFVPYTKDAWEGRNQEAYKARKERFVYLLNNRPNTFPARFFGYGSSKPFSLLGIQAAGSSGKAARITGLSRIWMISDVDGENYSYLGAKVKPINGRRNYAFFDGHVETLADDQRPANAPGVAKTSWQ